MKKPAKIIIGIIVVVGLLAIPGTIIFLNWWNDPANRAQRSHEALQRTTENLEKALSKKEILEKVEKAGYSTATLTPEELKIYNEIMGQ